MWKRPIINNNNVGKEGLEVVSTAAAAATPSVRRSPRKEGLGCKNKAASPTFLVLVTPAASHVLDDLVLLFEVDGFSSRVRLLFAGQLGAHLRRRHVQVQAAGEGEEEALV